MAKRKTLSWKHNKKTRKAWGTATTDKRNTPFMTEEEIEMEKEKEEPHYV